MLFEEQYKRLESATKEIWNEFSYYDLHWLNAPVTKGKWSPLQHMVHLNKSERSFIILLSRALKNNKPHKGSTLKTGLRRFLYKTYLRLGKKFKAPSIIEPSDEIFDIEVIKENFRKTRVQLCQLLAFLNQEQAGKFWITHHYLKELKVKDMLEFMIFHQEHHRKKFMRHLRKGAAN